MTNEQLKALLSEHPPETPVFLTIDGYAFQEVENLSTEVVVTYGFAGKTIILSPIKQSGAA